MIQMLYSETKCLHRCQSRLTKKVLENWEGKKQSILQDINKSTQLPAFSLTEHCMRVCAYKHVEPPLWARLLLRGVFAVLLSGNIKEAFMDVHTSFRAEKSFRCHKFESQSLKQGHVLTEWLLCNLSPVCSLLLQTLEQINSHAKMRGIMYASRQQNAHGINTMH